LNSGFAFSLGIGAIVVGAGVIVGGKSEEILLLAARFALPVMFASSRGARAGALLSYGADVAAGYRQHSHPEGRKSGRPSCYKVD
jgi:hypothetical protein